jgi:hypothetical protein
VLVDELDLGIADFVIGARPILGGDGRGSVGTANRGSPKSLNEAAILKDETPPGKPGQAPRSHKASHSR